MNQTKALITQIILMTLFPQQPKCPWQHSGGIYSGTSHNGPSPSGQPLYNGHWLWHQLKLLLN